MDSPNDNPTLQEKFDAHGGPKRRNIFLFKLAQILEVINGRKFQINVLRSKNTKTLSVGIPLEK